MLGGLLDLMILRAFSNLNYSMTLWFYHIMWTSGLCWWVSSRSLRGPDKLRHKGTFFNGHCRINKSPNAIYSPFSCSFPAPPNILKNFSVQRKGRAAHLSKTTQLGYPTFLSSLSNQNYSSSSLSEGYLYERYERFCLPEAYLLEVSFHSHYVKLN